MIAPSTTGVNVFVNQMLPFDESIRVCDVDTKEEFSLLTGKKIDCLAIGNDLHVSEELYEKIKTNLK